MTQAQAATSGLVRVTVASGTRRVDLVLPGAVPVAELVPELARSVGLLDAATVYGGYRVVLADGRHLAGDSGLILQGVEDGGVLTLTAGVDEEPPRVYDDVVEAMTDVVERELTPWRPEAGRRTALVAACLLLLLGAAALLIEGSRLSGSAAAVIAAVLVGAAVVLSRAEGEAEAAVSVGWMAEAYAAVAGLLLAAQRSPDPLVAIPLAYAGAGALAAGLLCLVGLGQGRMLVLPGVVVGAVYAAVGLLLHGVDWRPGVVLAVVLVVVVLWGSAFPWLALLLTATDVTPIYSPADITAEPDDIDPRRVASDARVAHELLVAISATVGLVLVLAAPWVVSLGRSGTLLTAVACAVVMLRTRQYRTGSEVLVGLASGVLGLLSTGIALLWLHPDWRATTAVVLAAAGGVLLVLTMVPGTASVRREWLADVAETLGLLALPALLILASGLVSSVRV